MAGQTSIVERLSAAESPDIPRAWEKEDGYYVATCRISKDDLPDLIEMARNWTDPDWNSDDLESYPVDVELLPVVAWRALADLKASESVEPLLQMLHDSDVEYDEWLSNDLPHVFGKIGRPAIQALSELASADASEYIRSIAVGGLQRIAENDQETRNEVVELLANMLKHSTEREMFNSALLVALVDLKAVEAAETIEQAFAQDRLDVGMMGDWEAVRRELGVPGLGLAMPDHPFNSLDEFEVRTGQGIFSQEPVFIDGEPDPDAEHAYYESAWRLFSESPEGQEVIDRGGDLGWHRSLLDFGLNYHGEIVDEFTVEVMEDFLFDYAPRKVSVEAKKARTIVDELTMFLRYVDRVHQLPNAKSIVDWLQQDDRATQLQTELADSGNFGMAKSIVMSGVEAGYDMTSEQGMAEFMAAYNNSLGSKSTSVPAAPIPRASASSPPRVGRNDPCPCGSGKKFKKCCR